MLRTAVLERSPFPWSPRTIGWGDLLVDTLSRYGEGRVAAVAWFELGGEGDVRRAGPHRGDQEEDGGEAEEACACSSPASFSSFPPCVGVSVEQVVH